MLNPERINPQKEKAQHRRKRLNRESRAEIKRQNPFIVGKKK
jgi:hypothetical protein